MLQPRVPIPALREHGERGIQDLVRARVGTTFPTKRFGGHGGKADRERGGVEGAVIYSGV